MKHNKNKTQYESMTEASITKLIVKLAIPTTITMLTTSIYNLADTYFVSQLGSSASAAIGVVFALMAILQAFGFMFGQGAGSNISRKLGAKDTESASKFASTSFFLSVATGIFIGVFGLIFLDPFMKLLGSTSTILPFSRIYGKYILIAAPAFVSSCVLNNILRFEGRASLAMIGLTLGSILNIVGDPLFIFKFNMGISGAGLSTAISQYISLIVLLIMFLKNKTQSKLSIYKISKDPRDYINIIKIGFPSLLRQGLGSISTMTLNWQAAIYGDVAIAAMSIVNRFCMFIFCICIGIGQGFQPVVGFNYGAGKYDRVKKSFKITLIISIIALGIPGVIGFIYSYKVIALFCNEKLVIEIGSLALRVQCMALFVMPISVCSNMLFQSCGYSKEATILASTRSGLCFIPLILILPHFVGVLGIQLAQPISDCLASIIAIPIVLNFFHRLS